MLNLYNEQLRLKAQMTCAYNAAHSGFKYLPIRFIINPPHQLPEAMLARQVAVHIMWNEFKIPRRRIASALHRQRTSISFNIQKINRRLQEPIFAREYTKWCEKARSSYARIAIKAGLKKVA